MFNHPAENVVLGFATNLHPERLELFAKTLRCVYSPQTCDLVIYTNKVDHQLCEIGKQYSVTFLHTANNYSPSVSKFSKLLNRSILYPARGLALATQNTPSLRIIFYEMYLQLLKLWHHPHFVRWFSYKDFLEANPHYQKILMSDVKDVAFQAPFFEEISASDLYFFKQDIQYGDDNNWDTRWYHESYGSKNLKAVEGKPALCIGTIMGNSKGVNAFLNVLCGEILKTPFIGIEQSVFNHLFYNNAFNHISLEIYENASGPVLTQTQKSWDRFRVRPDGVFTTDGKLMPVVHMYDRHQDAFDYFSQLLGYEMKEEGLVKQ
ncbi:MULTISPECIES: hypothetical protein [Cyanophyceae]|uniref:hypothetical protein n=1 Tax=Cyanophyceae TaxID=3028117 RepID=UPI00168203DC|nr:MULTISPECIES: hypothetical protein [Cyanophyceae]MBD1916694.1 hypothetical protein [Phormidium sp. FACHB-77]MBD2031764.1 hypothetical protein [Phormidium sp. FACHB-322]MBD2050514.1 hypothetical protein [Leptolyngbya sp. FACHB-60]